MSYFIQNMETGEFIGFGGKVVDEYPDAEKFEKRRDAEKVQEKLDYEWQIEEV